MRKVITCAMVCVLAALCLVACDDMFSTGFEFINNSSHTVYIAPNGQSWNPAMVSPGSSIVIDYSGTIQFVFTPSDKVKVGDNQPGVIIFVNK